MLDMYEKDYIKDVKFISETIKLNCIDKKNIEKIIKNRSKNFFTLTSYTDNYTEDESGVDIFKSKDGKSMTIEFNKDFDEVTNFIMEYLDKSKIKYKYGIERPTNTTWFTF